MNSRPLPGRPRLSRTALMAGVAGALLSVALMGVWEAHQYLARLPPDRVGWNGPLPLTAMAHVPAEVRHGHPGFRVAHVGDAPGKFSGTGVWGCQGPTTFEWRFDSDEVVYVLEGEVHVTYLSREFTLRPGDTAVFRQGTRAVWQVPEKVLKTYALHHPPVLVRWWRQWFW